MSIPRLLEALTSECNATASAAARALVSQGPRAVEVLPTILKLLRAGQLWAHDTPVTDDEDFAQTVLRGIGKPAAVPLAALLVESDSSIRGRAAKILVSMRSNALPALSLILHSLETESNDWVRILLLSAIGQFGEDGVEAAPALGRIAREPDPLFRRLACQALGELGSSALGELPGLIETLADSESSVRDASLFAIGAIGREAAGAAIAVRPLLRGVNSCERALAAHALGSIGCRAAIPDLTPLLEDPDACVRCEAVRALRTLDARGARATVELSVRDSDLMVRLEAILTMAFLADDDPAALHRALGIVTDSVWFLLLNQKPFIVLVSRGLRSDDLTIRQLADRCSRTLNGNKDAEFFVADPPR